MEQYGIDGVFVQRFGVETIQPKDLRHCNTVLAHCREGANRSGRCYAVMYDLSGLPAGGTRRVIEDWKLLVDRMKIGKDPKDAAYLRHQGKPVVAVWGVGFNDGRKYTLAECEKLVDFLKNDKDYGGCTVMLGVPTGWRTLDRDSVKDPALHRIIAKADVISPWTVGRYRSLQGVADHARQRWSPDGKWCKDQGKEYLPVVFPGFSWHNLRPKSALDEIPRLQGRFLWKQFGEAKKAGATMIYLAMFDEMDEGTAIFKCTNDPPVGASRFLTLEGLPSDHYLWLTGMGGKLLRGEIAATEELPPREKTESPQKSRDAGMARGAGQYFRVEYPPSTVADELQVGVTYTLWIPDGVKTLRGVIVHQHGAGTTASREGATAAYDLHWQALAKKWDCALLGPSYHVLNEKNDLSPGGSELWFDPRRGSEKTFLKALGDLAVKSGHPEVETVPWGLWGHSGGGIWSDVMATLHPDRVVAVWLRSGSAVMFLTHPEFTRPKVPAAVYCDPHDVQSRREGKARLDGKTRRAGQAHPGGKNEGPVARQAGHLQGIPRQGRADRLRPGPAHRPRVRRLPLPGHSVPRRLPGHALAGQGRARIKPSSRST